jgi:hypothetical protein
MTTQEQTIADAEILKAAADQMDDVAGSLMDLNFREGFNPIAKIVLRSVNESLREAMSLLAELQAAMDGEE